MTARNSTDFWNCACGHGNIHISHRTCGDCGASRERAEVRPSRASANRESPILYSVRAALAAEALVHRNNVGVDVTRGVRYGLGVGSPDLVACVPVHVLIVPRETPGAVLVGRYAGFEVKAAGRLTTEQQQWHAAARARGAFVATVRSGESALEALTRARAGASE